ncbi:sigma 54-interacting transcriptional regulator [Candidatus Thalassolituus haligoni]|mgnify:CR=1 FL=1|uniref:sigma 54-interacting transcriptional regulator n=1 Tax=Candidatus Thalassolituus haligoni TaxID=3100113 RepID=UPI00351836C0|tara:strand:+ start:639 stop:2378 length:1740 start_codon:yes stop_codon:yes gene_type:complete
MTTSSATSNNVQPPEVPDAKDLISQIRFCHEKGEIWLQEARMLLIHASDMGILREELVTSMGMERARGFLMRFGYQSGQRDAEVAHKIRSHMSLEQGFMAGVQLHAIEGIALVVAKKVQLDPSIHHFYGEFDWHGSYEADQYLAKHELSDSPVCWTLLGYASGYTSAFLGMPILYKEVQCRGMGHEHCSIVGKPAEQWEDREAMQRLMTPDHLADELFSLQQQVCHLKASFRQGALDDDLLTNSVGQSEAFMQVCQLIRKASQSRATVLLQGETGVGKEVVARGLHNASDRANKAFIAVNCACIPPDLIEAELFGVEKGAFTGATVSREGRFERANGGTIFLDEVIELSPRAQATLLRVLQESELERVGDNQTRAIDVRVVAATNEDLEKAVKEGRFRADLFFRLNVFPVRIPPLRERLQDIPLLAEYFLEKYQNLYRKQLAGITDKAMQSLIRYKWPGNIRELENMIERGVILTDNGTSIDLCNLFPSLMEPSHPLNVIDQNGSLSASTSQLIVQQNHIRSLIDGGVGLEEVEKQMLQQAMEQSANNITHAAQLLGISRAAMSYRLKKLNDMEKNDSQ